jgi:NAD(P)-dependent dehydrogenase (short-subunit alcohol dehydrogenase family)
VPVQRYHARNGLEVHIIHSPKVEARSGVPMTDGLLELAGKRALVIGAGTPAGRAAAVALAAAGADVAVASGSIDGDEVMAVRRARRAIEALGRRTAEYAFDLTLGANVRVSTRQVAKEIGGLDILVNAADVYLRRSTESTSDSDWSRVLNVNLNGVFYACRSALKEMEEHGGAIVNVCSVLGERGGVESAAYCAARHGVIGLTRALALEYAGRNIRVNAVALGWLQGVPQDISPLPPASMPEKSDAVQSVGPLVVYLVSAASGFVNGQVFTLDGSPDAV